jgi:hypothetical protein
MTAAKRTQRRKKANSPKVAARPKPASLLDGHAYAVPDGVRGFDANQTITPQIAAAFRGRGYRFCIRYVRRKDQHSYDLTRDEAAGLLAAGLGLMVVQHVAPEGWRPTAKDGTAYGTTAAKECSAIGVPAGVTLWCDLEGVASGTSAKQVIDFCNNWHSAAAAAGFVPGLYVGFGAGLGPAQLYQDLRFTHYWAAYNLNADQFPAVRGVQMRQAERSAADKVPGYTFEFQTDFVNADKLGGRPTLLAPEIWLD